jgi:hypothetical protein
MHAGIAVGGGLSIMIFGARLGRALDTGSPQPMRSSAMTVEIES